jgi:bla regulator protein BlaR1
MIPGLINHLWQSTLFAAAAWLVTLALKRNRAQVRYWVWLAASVKFLLPFSVLANLGALAPRQTATVRMPVVVEQIVQPFGVAAPSVTQEVKTRADLTPELLWLAWACGFGAMLISFGRKWTRMHANVRAAKPIRLDLPVPVRTSAALYEPGVFGIFRPILLLPDGIIEKLSPSQLSAILAHELCHVRRRDNLTATIHMAVQAIFWFHPLVWWIGVRLIDERERACDEEVLRLGSAPQDYAEGILNVCRLYVESPLGCVSGVTGSDLKKRIEAIMTNRIIQKLSVGRKALMAGAGMFAMVVPIVVGVLNVPAIRGQEPPVQKKFEVASIRACRDVPADRRLALGASPGRFTAECGSVEALIQLAYIRFANGRLNEAAPIPISVSGGPAWISSEHYTINAKAADNASPETIQGPMLQALLEDRFKLKTHRETKEVPVYQLTAAAKGGPKLQPAQEGNCIAQALRARRARGGDDASVPAVTYCGDVFRKGANMVADFHEVNLGDFSRVFGRFVDRPIIDKTGISGRFDIHLEFMPDQATPRLGPGGDPNGPPAATDADVGPSIFTAIQEQVGLKLEPAKGPGEFLVIDSVERPSEN